MNLEKLKKGLTPAFRRLPIQELSPQVSLAGCFHFEEDMFFPYRLPAHHLILIESGRISANPPTGPFEAKAGDLICFRPAKVNQYTARGPVVFYQISVRFASPPRHQLTPWLGKRGELPVLVSLDGAFDAMRRVFETFCLEISQPGTSHQLRVKAAVFELLAIADDVLAAQASSGPHLDDWERLQMRLSYRLDEKIRVSALAREMHVSQRYFIRHFKKRFGLSPKAFHTRARLHKAARLLRTTDQQIKVIAADLGFGNTRLFQQLFKRYFGASASDIRSNSIYVAKRESLTENAHSFFMNHFNLPPNTPPTWMNHARLPKRVIEEILAQRNRKEDVSS